MSSFISLSQVFCVNYNHPVLSDSLHSTEFASDFIPTLSADYQFIIAEAKGCKCFPNCFKTSTKDKLKNFVSRKFKTKEDDDFAVFFDEAKNSASQYSTRLKNWNPRGAIKHLRRKTKNLFTNCLTADAPAYSVFTDDGSVKEGDPIVSESTSHVSTSASEVAQSTSQLAKSTSQFSKSTSRIIESDVNSGVHVVKAVPHSKYIPAVKYDPHSKFILPLYPAVHVKSDHVDSVPSVFTITAPVINVVPPTPSVIQTNNLHVIKPDLHVIKPALRVVQSDISAGEKALHPPVASVPFRPLQVQHIKGSLENMYHELSLYNLDKATKSANLTDQSTKSAYATDQSINSANLTDQSTKSANLTDQSTKSAYATDQSINSANLTDQSTKSATLTYEPTKVRNMNEAAAVLRAANTARLADRISKTTCQSDNESGIFSVNYEKASSKTRKKMHRLPRSLKNSLRSSSDSSDPLSGRSLTDASSLSSASNASATSGETSTGLSLKSSIKSSLLPSKHKHKHKHFDKYSCDSNIKF